MAFNLPEYVFDDSQPDTVGLPAYVFDGSQPDTVGLSAYVFDNSQPVALKLPTYGFTEAEILEFTHVPTGGVVLGGGADIVGDPIVPTGGIVYGGEAPVSHTYVQISLIYPLGGVVCGGAAPVSAAWIEHSPLGGVVYGGAASVSSVLLNIFTHTPTGGVTLAGHAEDIVVIPSGGITFGGAAEVVAIVPLVVIPTGGLTLGGAAATNTTAQHTASGGVVLGGGATMAFNFPAHVPAGGVALGGAALFYAVPAGAAAMPENPYYYPYPAWAINLDTNAPSRYKGFVANSFCQLNGKTYVANAGGIYEVGDFDDAGQPIQAVIKLPKTDFGEGRGKRAEVAWLGAKSDGKLRLGVMTDAQEASYYSVDLSDTGGVRGSKVKLGKGLEGRYWQFQIENVDGSSMELDTFEHDMALSTTRRKK